MNLFRVFTHWLRCTVALACAPDDEPDLVRQRRRYRDQGAEYIRLRFRYGWCRFRVFLLGGSGR